MEAQGKGGAGCGRRARRGDEHGTANHRMDRNQGEREKQQCRHNEQQIGKHLTAGSVDQLHPETETAEQ